MFTTSNVAALIFVLSLYGLFGSGYAGPDLGQGILGTCPGAPTEKDPRQMEHHP